EQPKAWEPGAFTSPPRFHAFMHLRDLRQAERSTLRALNEHRIACLKTSAARMVNGRWKAWSTQDDWAGRLAAWDTEVDRQRRERFLEAQAAAIERHARLTQAALSVVTVPVRTILARMADPTFVAGLETQPAWSLLRESWRAIALVPELIAAERASLGL